MKLYLDDNSADPRLAEALRKAGYDVLLPVEAGYAGSTDPRHWRLALEQGRALLTRDYHDFLDLHELVMAAGGRHPGLLVVRADNDPARDLTTRGIAAAISRLEGSGLPILDQIHILNHWR